MKNTSYEERKKCCLKELLGQTPRRVYGKPQLIEERVHPIAIMFVAF
jgi:hypothetical protein